MLALYNPTPGTTAGATLNTNGKVGDDVLLLNVLIELRVANAMAMDMQRGLVVQTLEEYRSDVVNAVVNPVI